MKWFNAVLKMILPSECGNGNFYSYDHPLKRNQYYTTFAESIKPFVYELLEDILESYKHCFASTAKLRGQKANAPTAALCIIYREEYHSNILFQVCFDELKHKAEQLGYYLTYSNIKVEESEHLKKETEMYYLKAYPGELVDGYKHNQLWGQLFLEHHMIDEESNFIKIRCNYYLGRNYTTPLPFDDLIEQLCRS